MKQYNHWQTDMNRFTSSVEDIIHKLGIEGEIISVESDNNQVCKWLDKVSGVDYVVKNNNDVFGIAMRIQEIAPTSSSYDSFTIRSTRSSGNTTEFVKRINSIHSGSFYPAYTIQAYVQDGEILSAACVNTKNLYEFIKLHSYMIKKRWSDNEFLIVKWSDLLYAEYYVKIYKK